MIKKADIFIIVFVLFFFVLTSCFVYFNKNDENIRYVEIYIEEKKEYSYFLDKNTNENVKINNKYGYNEIIIKNGEVYVENSDCKGRDCVNVGKISKNGEFIICSPHKLLVKIGKGNDDDVQAVSY